MTTIQIRTDEKLKRDVKRILKDIGIDVSSAINLYLRQIVITESIPFPIRTSNGFTVEQEREMKQEIEEAVRSSRSYTSAEELHRAILGSDYDRWRKSCVPDRRDEAVPSRSQEAAKRRKVRRRQAR